MSESIYTILANGNTMTAVKNEGDYSMDLPDSMPSPDQFQDAEALQEWAENNGVMHSCLQKGIQKHLIDLRAKFRQVKKDEDWDHGTAQDNVNATEWDIVLPPKTKKSQEQIAKEYLASLSPAELKKFLAG